MITRRESFLGLMVAISGLAQEQAKPLTRVTGTLQRAMAIGGETSGWSIALDKPLDIEGNELSTIEVSARDNAQLEKLNGQRVVATGRLTHAQGVETGSRNVLNVLTIRAWQTIAQTGLTGTEWMLDGLNGKAVIRDSKASLSFPETGKVAGNGSCNRFSGTVEINGDSLKFGALAATRMMCFGAPMEQETKYLKALGSVERFERKGTALRLYSKDSSRPVLTFTAKLAK